MDENQYDYSQMCSNDWDVDRWACVWKERNDLASLSLRFRISVRRSSQRCVSVCMAVTDDSDLWITVCDTEELRSISTSCALFVRSCVLSDIIRMLLFQREMSEETMNRVVKLERTQKKSRTQINTCIQRILAEFNRLGDRLTRLEDRLTDAEGQSRKGLEKLNVRIDAGNTRMNNIDGRMNHLDGLINRTTDETGKNHWKQSEWESSHF